MVARSDELDWDYLRMSSSELKMDLRGFLLRSIERIPLTVDNPPKVRKRLRGLIEDAL